MSRIDRVQICFAQGRQLTVQYELSLSPVDDGFWFVEEIELLKNSEHIGGWHRILLVRSRPWRFRYSRPANETDGPRLSRRTPPILLEPSPETQCDDRVLHAVVTVRPVLPVPCASRSDA